MKRFIKKHKILTGFVCIVLILALVFGLSQARARKQDLGTADVYTLTRMDLRQIVPATGTVESAASRAVTAAAAYPIKEIYVSAGDYVKKDARLAKLDAYGSVYIKAPVSGTVTAVNASVGAAAAGVLFVIEDLTKLQINVDIPEYDAVTIKVGMSAELTSDAIVGTEWAGQVKSISPTASAIDHTFTVTVEVTGDLGRLTPGMSAKVNIICAEKVNVFAVPYDAVVKNDIGQQVIYVVDPLPEDKQTGSATRYDDANRRAIPVTLGMESDYYLEIISDELREGLYILPDPNNRNASSDSNGRFFPWG